MSLFCIEPSKADCDYDTMALYLEVLCQLVEQRSKFIGEVWIGCKSLILKLSKVLSVEEVKGPYIHPNQRLILIQKW
jgi:hypothetical protein